MSYSAALDSLHARVGELHAQPGQPRRKFRLEEMRTLAEALGHPERAFRSVLIAGTNGKGSTAATLAAVLQSAGYRCGLYTSPHLVRVNERVRIDGQPIADDSFARLYFRVDDCAHRLVQEGRLPSPPSFFETLTALAFLAFAEARVDLAVLEVGMGGRLDATNVVEPLVSVITDISLDHMEWLGDTIPQIAHEKAGILRKDGVLITLPQHPQANEAIGEVATELDVRGVNAAEYMPVRHIGPMNHYGLQVMGETVEVDSPLMGAHQSRNIALAIATAVELSTHHGFNITPARIAEGIRNTWWPGRLERIPVRGRADVWLDVAHNPAGAWALRAALSAMREQDDGSANGSSVLVFGCMKDKAYEEMAQILFPIFDRIVVTPVASPRSATTEELMEAAAKTGVPVVAARDAREALELAWKQTNGPVVVAGSVYLVGEVKPLLQSSVAEGLAVTTR
ncbi:MAG TPA: folylpolyglutamate synthase/dihydrofolate synthase family protein [Acidobacteriaceae bacterium]|jgi:dihydrofolate synthase/folylpolyglutamate synthase|nr:folylpolyglutamate synthase/dihydrofolate synthase family protein [Acidobacteriaceae bacterium]